MSVTISKNRLEYALIVADRAANSVDIHRAGAACVALGELGFYATVVKDYSREVMPIMFRETEYESWTVCVFIDGAWKVDAQTEKGPSL